MLQQLTLRNLEKPKVKNPKRDIFWICDSLGLSRGRDTEGLSSRTVLTLLNRFREDAGASSEMLARDLGVSPARVNYHVRTLIETGMLYREKKLIYLRAGSLKSAVEEMQKDANRIFEELKDVAEEIDTALGFQNRE